MTTTRTDWLEHAATILSAIMAERTGLTPEWSKVACGLDGLSIGFALSLWDARPFNPPAGAQCPATGEIMINPAIPDGVGVLGVLCHELAHATMPPADMGHGPAFMSCCHAMGMEGSPHNIQSGAEFAEIARDIIAQLGDYPPD